MSLVIPINNSHLAIESLSKTIPISIIGMALGYSAYEKVAQIIHAKFPATNTAFLPYIGLVAGIFATPQTIVIYAVALLILIPLKYLVVKEQGSIKMPSHMEDMKETQALKKQHYTPLIEEIKTVGITLSKVEKRNVLLLGDPGSGKTSLIECIVQMQLKNSTDLPKALINKKFYKVSCINLMSGTTFRGELEGRIQEVCKFAASDKNIVVVFDEIHQLASANKSTIGSSISILDFLKEKLARDEISVVGMTTTAEYKQHIAPDAALVRRFAQIHLKELSFEQSVEMLRERTKTLKKTHPSIEISDETIYKHTLDLVKTLPKQTSLIDLAFDLLDTVFSAVSYESNKVINREKVEEVFHKKKKDGEQGSTVAFGMYG